MLDQYVQVSLPVTLDYTHPQLVFIAARWNAAEQPLLVLPRSVCRSYGRSPVKLSSGLSDPDPQGIVACARLLSIEHLVPTTNHLDVNVSWLTLAVEVSPSTNFTRRFALRRRREPRKRKVTSKYRPII
jgi:hypothetical protein